MAALTVYSISGMGGERSILLAEVSQRQHIRASLPISTTGQPAIANRKRTRYDTDISQSGYHSAIRSQHEDSINILAYLAR